MILMVTGAQVAFWIAAPIALILAVGMVVARKAVHSALSLAGVMVALGVLYASLDAPFLFVTQIIVYTGSVMMLFLFTMMLIGVDNIDQLKETLRGQRVAAIVAALAFGVLLCLVFGQAIVGPATGNSETNAQFGGNAQAIANLVFSRYVFAFEAAAALVITAALAAMVLAHADHFAPKEKQKGRMLRRMQEYATTGASISPDPAPGVYARGNSADLPALRPDGTVEPTSYSNTLEERGLMVHDVTHLQVPVAQAHLEWNAAQLELDANSPVIPVPQPVLDAMDRATAELPEPTEVPELEGTMVEEDEPLGEDVSKPSLPEETQDDSAEQEDDK